MEIEETKLKGCYILKPRVFNDERGYFFESFYQKEFNELIGQEVDFVQDNHSFSKYGVLRGLHFQTGDSAQAKLVRVISGEVLDVAVDLRENSPTYGQHVDVIISADNIKQMFIPKGFAHGFIVLSKFAEFLYKCDNYYDSLSESGIHPINNPLGIDWQIPKDQIIISQKDQVLPTRFSHL